MLLGTGFIAGCYAGFALEASLGSRSIAPHLPLAFLIGAVWMLPVSPAVLVAALIGLGCDALGPGPLGPGMLSATLAAWIGSNVRNREELSSPLAFVLLGAAMIGVTFAGQVGLTAFIAQHSLDLKPAALVISARTAATALVALTPLLLLRACRAFVRR
jgi:rod shape-determining protein MreD